MFVVGERYLRSGDAGRELDSLAAVLVDDHQLANLEPLGLGVDLWGQRWHRLGPLGLESFNR